MQAMFRVRYPKLKQLLLRFRGSDKSTLDVSSNRVSSDLKHVAETLGFLQTAGDSTSIALTSKGREMLLAYENNQPDHEKRLLKSAFEQNRELRLHWAAVCDRKEIFTTAELMEVFRDLGYSKVVDTSLRQYIRAFVDWAVVAGLCTKASFKGHSYRILDRMIIGSPTSEGGNARVPRSAMDTVKPQTDDRLNLFKLNSYVCDYLADESHQGDLNKIDAELEGLRGKGYVDDLVIDMLEREIKTALQTRSKVDFAMVAQSLRDIRKRYAHER